MSNREDIPDSYDGDVTAALDAVLIELRRLLPLSPLLTVLERLEATNEPYWIFTLMSRDGEDFSAGAGSGDDFQAETGATWPDALRALASAVEGEAGT